MVCLFSSPEYAPCVNLATSCCCSIRFCIALCVVLALNSWAVQSKACISAAKYDCSLFFWKLWWNDFQIIFTENKIKQNWWRKCQSSEGTSVPVEIQIWEKSTDGESAKAVREQVFLSRYKSESGIEESSVLQIFCILPVLPLRLFSSPCRQKWHQQKSLPLVCG